MAQNPPVTRSQKRAVARRRLNEDLRNLFANCRDPVRLIELYYWSREPGLIDIIRGIVAMPDETRAAVEAFFAMAQEPEAIAAKFDPRGRLSLASPDVDRALAIAQHLLACDGRDTPGSLN